MGIEVVSGIPFVRSETSVFYKNTQNGFWCQIHVLGKDLLLMAREHVPHSYFSSEQNEVNELVHNRKHQLSF